MGIVPGILRWLWNSHRVLKTVLSWLSGRDLAVYKSSQLSLFAKWSIDTGPHNRGVGGLSLSTFQHP